MAEPESMPPSFEVFERMPPPTFVDRVKAHVVETALPETFPGLHPGPVGKDEPFLILSPISIPRGKRNDGRKAPCPMCQPNKFLEGKLVYLLNLKAAAIIGHCCASKETRSEAEREYKARERLERAEEFLLNWLPKQEETRQRAGGILAPAKEVQRIYASLRKDGGKFQRAIHRGAKASGILSVTVVKENAGGPSGMRTSGSSVQTEDITFGRLMGAVLVAPQCKIGDLLAELVPLQRWHCGTSEDEVLNFILELSSLEKIELSEVVKSAEEALGRIAAIVEDARQFFDAKNLRVLNAWASHPASSMRMLFSMKPFSSDRHLFEIKGPARSRFALVIDSNALWPDRQALAA